ncbi:GTP-sensing pleiotropic transcriptional regulator CodY [Natroniella sulfidigena]|uniref:GTP-sensing pleiotropic transcriptional regulator CodY n=1 Tax=Natroniella sulfidigena TaxID=723921 RepID=UPI00200B3C2E|nr:GTP-sensing pleiotropic transcriptional regulator CodY [Natroniella sulfidigena]MCK8817658.1 GTP-sensing pleiotropic transcriptional regulator CodY [Natroniella sulfidigena]
MKKLLNKTRQINKLLQRSVNREIDFNEVANILKRVIKANVYLVDKRGKILGFNLLAKFECELMHQEVIDRGEFPEDYNDWLLDHYDTQANYRQTSSNCVFKDEVCIFKNKLTTVVPINGSGERLGTLVIARFDNEFESSDLLLAEYGAAVVGMEILRLKNKKMEKEVRQRAAAKIAIETLSYSELDAIYNILKEVEGEEGLLVASKIADRIGITRSVIVNALRKFESAGVIKSRSLGMKGTHIKILNKQVVDHLEKAQI